VLFLLLFLFRPLALLLLALVLLLVLLLLAPLAWIGCYRREYQMAPTRLEFGG